MSDIALISSASPPTPYITDACRVRGKMTRLGHSQAYKRLTGYRFCGNAVAEFDHLRRAIEFQRAATVAWHFQDNVGRVGWPQLALTWTYCRTMQIIPGDLPDCAGVERPALLACDGWW